MNKIYSLKYSAATGGLITLSDLAKEFQVKQVEYLYQAYYFLL